MNDHPTGQHRITWVPATIALMTLVALVLRLRHLGDGSLWFDEGASVQFATMPVRAWLRFLWHGEANMLPYYLVLRGWLVFGHSDFMVRLPSVLFGIATVPTIYLLARRMSGMPAGVIAAGLLTVHGFHVSYSQQARSYSMVVFLLSASWFALASLVERESKRARWAYLINAGLATYAHFFAGIVLISQAISIWSFAPEEARRRFGKLQLLTAAITLPAIPYGFAHRGALNWVPALTSVQLMHTADLFSGNGAPLVAIFALLLVFAIGRAAKIIATSGRSVSTWNSAAPVCWLLFTPAFLLAVSVFKPVFVARYLLLVLPALLIVAAAVLAELKPFAAAAVGVLLALALLHVTLMDKGFDQPHQDWRAAVTYLEGHVVTGDAAVFLPDIGRAPFNWYWQQQHPARPLMFPGRGPTFAWPAAHRPPALALDTIKSAPPPRTWFLLTTPDLDPKVPLFRQELSSIYPYSCQHQLTEVLIVLYSHTREDCPLR